MDSSVVSSSGTAGQTVVIQSTSPNGSGRTDDRITMKEHPLLNPLIVDKIVEQLNPSFEQLKTLRLVSKVWADATLHHWRNDCAVLTLIPDPAPTLFTSTEPCKKGVPVFKFFEQFQDPQNPNQLSTKPFSKYKFKGLTFDIQVCNKPGGPAQTFWNSIGPLIESLYLEDCVFMEMEPYSVNVTSPMVQLLVAMMPNVKDLILKNLAIQGTQEKWQVFTERPHLNLRTLTVYTMERWNNVMLKDLFKLAPYLESINGMGVNTPQLMEQIYQVRFISKPEDEEGVVSPLPLSNLKHLDLINSNVITTTEYSKSVNVACELLPLETLSLHLEASPVSRLHYTDLNMCLTSFSGTLKTLELYLPPVEPPYLFLSGASSASEMSLLTELHLWGAIASNFAFLKSTPNLKKLIINLGCFEKREQVKNWIKEHREKYGGNVTYLKYEGDMVANVPTNLKEGGILCTQLEHLEIDYEFREESLRILGKWMPNLKKLRTILNGSTIPVVCEIWRELTELVCLHGSRVDNSCVIKDDEEKVGFSGDALPKLKICDLKDLERFQVNTYCGESKLTEKAVFNGFLKMSGLKSVHICVNDSEMSEEAEEALKKGVPFCEVIRNDGLECYDGKYDDDGNEICECDRCAFRTDVERGFLETDDEEDEDGSGSEEGEIEEDDNMGDSDESGEENEDP